LDPVMENLIETAKSIHDTIFGAIEKALDGWFLALSARLVFASVLLLYYLHSVGTKVHDGFPGIFIVADNAYYQILPPVIEAAGYDASNIAIFPWKIIAYLGTYAEFALPLLIVSGLFTRIASVGMIIFIFVQSFVDVQFHQIGAEATGGLFDRFPDAVIFDQRLLWIFPLVYLAVKGAGSLSADAVVSRLWLKRAPAIRSHRTA
jgi:putative oxidoreductase